MEYVRYSNFVLVSYLCVCWFFPSPLLDVGVQGIAFVEFLVVYEAKVAINYQSCKRCFLVCVNVKSLSLKYFLKMVDIAVWFSHMSISMCEHPFRPRS